MQYVKDLVAESCKVRMARGDPALCNALLERAYALGPDDINVWIEQYTVFEYLKRIIEKLERCIKIFKRLQQEFGADDRSTKFWHEKFQECFIEAYNALLSNNPEALAQIKRYKIFLDLHEGEYFQFYLLRSLYFSNNGDSTAALRDAEKVLTIMKPEHLPNQAYFSWYIEFTKTMIHNLTT